MPQVMKSDKPWYIHDQIWRVLIATDDPRPYLNPEEMRPGRITETEALQARDSKWVRVRNRDDVVFNRDCLHDEDGQPINFRLLAITSDAGMGKSDATKWIHYRINCPRAETVDEADPSSEVQAVDRARLAGTRDTEMVPASSTRGRNENQFSFHFEIRQFVQDYRPQKRTIEADVKQAMAKLWSDACVSRGIQVNEHQLLPQIEAMLRRGEICLIFDGLDQVGDDEIAVVSWILDSPECEHCRFIVAGRPNAIITKWDKLFAGRPWAFLQVDDFNRAQQVRYLGWLPDKTLRYRAIDVDARPILYVPRVLTYLRDRNDFTDIRTAADVYYFAIDLMISDGLREMLSGTEPDDDQIRGLVALLAITAFETTRLFHGDSSTFVRDQNDRTTLLSQPSRATSEPPDYEFNLGTVRGSGKEDGNFGELLTQIKSSYDDRSLFGNADTQWKLLGRLNAILDHGIFDDNRVGLNQVVWSNRSLHEFLLAYYYSKLARPAECDRLWDWIYIAGVPSTDKYYQFWQFLCDIPASGRHALRWLNAIELIYWPNISDDSFGNRAGDDPDNPRSPFYSKRSTEMIYRSWSTLDTYCGSRMQDVKRLANRIRDRWWGEFESSFLLEPVFGVKYQETAKAIVNHLMPIPGGDFIMGTTENKQRIAELIDHGTSEFNAWRENPDQIAEFFDTGLLRSYFESRGGRRLRDEWEPNWHQYVREGDLDSYLRERYLLGTEQRTVCQVGPFCLGRNTVSNAFYRLFDPDHGITLRNSGYVDYSKTEKHPVIRVSFFDCFVFCQWLRWAGDSCRLPWEDEWEFAAKIGLPDWSQGYWWADDFDRQRDRERINCRETDYGQTLIPSSGRASPASRALDREQGGTGDGLMDLLGNVWEWCQDRFRYDYGSTSEVRRERRAEDCGINPSVSRSLRGGSFDYNAQNAPCSYRIHFDPSIALNDYGFRVARARKSSSLFP